MSVSPTRAIDRVLRLGAVASLKAEGCAKTGARFHRELHPGIFHIVRAVPQRFSDPDITEFDLHLSVTFADVYEAFQRARFPKNPLSVLPDVVIALGPDGLHQGSWVTATQRATPADATTSTEIVKALSEFAYPLLRSIDSVKAGFEVFSSMPQDGMSDLVLVETKVAFLLALGRQRQASEAVAAALLGRGADADDPFAESIREMASRLGLDGMG